MHPLAKLGEHDTRPLAIEELVAELAFKRLDRAGEGGLRDVAFFGGTREVARPDHRQEISHLVHFHDLLHQLGRGLFAARPFAFQRPFGMSIELAMASISPRLMPISRSVRSSSADRTIRVARR